MVDVSAEIGLVVARDPMTKVAVAFKKKKVRARVMTKKVNISNSDRGL